MSIDPKMQIFFDEAERLMSSPKTFKDIFDIEIDTWSQRRLFIYEDENGKAQTVRYFEFAKIAKQYAFALSKKISAPKGSFVALKMNNSPKWAYAFWGLLIAGYNTLMINPILLTSDVNRLIKEADAKAVINDNDEKLEVDNININSLELSEELNPDKFADYIAFCTSGTTGKSRIFVYNSENMSYQIYAAYCMPETTKTIMYQNPEVRLATIVPFSHIFGFVAVFCADCLFVIIIINRFRRFSQRLIHIRYRIHLHIPDLFCFCLDIRQFFHFLFNITMFRINLDLCS